jgi:signal peptidase I
MMHHEAPGLRGLSARRGEKVHPTIKCVERTAGQVCLRKVNANKLRLRAKHFWHREIKPLLVLAIILFSIRSSLADWNDVPTGSMKPTIVEGDRVFVNKLAYDLKVPFTTWHIAEWGNPQQGDIVVFYSPHDGMRLVKRVIGLPGDTIEMRNGHLVLNGEPVEYAALDEAVSAQVSESERNTSLFATEKLPSRPHAVMAIPALPAQRNFGPLLVPEGRYFMMGDNRDNSFDSRFWGTVPRGQILGRATAVVISLDRTNWWKPRLDRSFTKLN